MPDKTQIELIREIHQTTAQLSTVLLGVPNTEDTGLVGEVKDIKLTVNGVSKSHSKLKRNFWILVATLVGSGILGSGIWSALNG